MADPNETIEERQARHEAGKVQEWGYPQVTAVHPTEKFAKPHPSDAPAAGPDPDDLAPPVVDAPDYAEAAQADADDPQPVDPEPQPEPEPAKPAPTPRKRAPRGS